ncbi:hypothetical protein [Prosthecobacter sp.]|uniref:hypothetical protein n=1 Tax=Prosthecobacter sp. TaxID=1965333 RepID=UPI00378463C9
MNNRRHDPKPLARLVHLLLLIGMLFSSQGVAPAICMVAALIDGDHLVKVGVSHEGAMTVVLSHAGKSAAELTSHEHDALCRVLMTFAEAPASGASDHVLAFKRVEDVARAQRLISSAQGVAKQAVPLLVLDLQKFHAPAADSADSADRHFRRHVWTPGLALKACRTVMRC